MLATGAFGIATGGEVALFGPILLIDLLLAVIVGSRFMIAALWAIAVSTVAAVLAITHPGDPLFVWTVLFFAFSSGLVAGIVDLTVRNARSGLRSLEAVADFTSFACSVRDWDVDAEDVLRKVADSVEAATLVVYERRHSGSGQVRELARWIRGTELSPFVESELRRLAERAQPDGAFEVMAPSNRRARLLAIAAKATASDIIIAVEMDRVGQRDDAALIAAVSSLSSVIDRTNLIEQLVGEARTDPLTGLANRRQLQDYVVHAIGSSQRRGEPLAVAMIDLDHFKQFNDRFGHRAGDQVLQQFAYRLRARLRAQDIAARYGGEEFCILLPGTTAADAQQVLEDLRTTIDQCEGERVTFSAGVAELCGHGSGDALIADADAALYRAKRAGRNRTAIAPPHHLAPRR
jgi:diguanylate cyclase (GGDEF)-like protein